MSYYRITKLEMPQAGSWGILQINGFENTHFRFDIREGKPLLDNSFFADGLENPQEKHRKMDAESDFYKGIQQALEQYLNGKFEMNCEGCGKKTLVEVGNVYCEDCYAEWLDGQDRQSRKAWEEREKIDED